jgi:DNA topoisomerase VI subunit B
MSDDTPTPENEIVDELRSLGRNLKGVLQTAWESEERRKLQNEIQAGLAELQKTVADFATSPTGQRLKADVQDLGERVRSRQVESQLRNDLLAALRTINAELEKAAKKGKDAPPPGTPPAA